MKEKFLGSELERDSMLLRDLQPIERTGEYPTREALEAMVEYPLLEACQQLYDKNIRTIMSSANQKDIAIGSAYIVLDFDTLSAENKEIALNLGEPYEVHGGRGHQGVNIRIPITENTTAGEIKSQALEIVSRFKTQPMTWARTYTMEQMKKWIKPDVTPEEVEQETRTHYDPESGLFYTNKEDIEKVKRGRGSASLNDHLTS